MINYKILGAGICIGSLLALFLEKISNTGLSRIFAQLACGDRYMIEPNLYNAASGILTQNACGFNADMRFVVVFATCLVLGLLLVVIGQTGDQHQQKQF